MEKNVMVNNSFQYTFHKSVTPLQYFVALYHCHAKWIKVKLLF